MIDSLNEHDIAIGCQRKTFPIALYGYINTGSRNFCMDIFVGTFSSHEISKKGRKIFNS